MKELRADNQEEGVDTNYKFSKEWARDKKENERLQKEYLEKLKSNKSIVSFPPLKGQTQELQKNQTINHSKPVEKEKQANKRETSHTNPILEETFNKARRKRRAGLFVAILCIALILWILASGANKKEELEVDTTNTVQTMGPTP